MDVTPLCCRFQLQSGLRGEERYTELVGLQLSPSCRAGNSVCDRSQPGVNSAVYTHRYGYVWVCSGEGLPIHICYDVTGCFGFVRSGSLEHWIYLFKGYVTNKK